MTTDDTNKDRAAALWQDLVQEERHFVAARMALFAAGVDIDGLIDNALLDPGERGTALRLLRILEEPRRRQFLPTLIDLAFTVQGDLHLIQDVIRSLDAEWLARQVPCIVNLY